MYSSGGVLFKNEGRNEIKKNGTTFIIIGLKIIMPLQKMSHSIIMNVARFFLFQYIPHL
jgi:hypothetical protein